MTAALLRRLTVATIVTCALLALVVAAAPSTAQESTPEVRLHVTGLAGLIGPEDVPGATDSLSLRALVDNVGDEAAGDLRLLVEVFEPVTTRSELHLAVDEDRPQGRLLADAFVDVAGGGVLPAGEVAGATVDVPGDGFAVGDGVYPVRISLLHGREVIDEATTAAVHLSREPVRPLRTVLSWPLWASPAPPDGLGEVASEVGSGGRLERLVWALEQRPDAPVQVLVAPHLLEDLALHAAQAPDGRDLLERLVAAVADRPAPVTSAYADADLAGLAASGLTVEALQQMLEGRRITEELLGRPPADALWETGTTSSRVLRDVLGPARIRHVLVPWSRLEEPGEPPETPPTFRILTPGGGGTVALVGDPWLERRLAELRGGPDLIGVQTILAESAFIHRERPFAADRSLLLLPPVDWAPSPEVADGLLAALETAPWLTLEGIDGITARGTRPGGTARLSPPPQSTMDASLWANVGDARERLATVRDALADPSDGLGGLSWAELDRRILRAASATAGSAANRARLDEVATALDDGIGDLELPSEGRITLTDVEGTVPITVARSEGPPVHVTITLDAPPRLGFPGGASRSIVIGAGERQTVTFDAAAHAVGRVPVTVRATLGPASSPVAFTEGSVVVRSTAVSGIALAVLGALLAVLLVWWVVRRRRPPPAPELRVVERDAA